MAKKRKPKVIRKPRIVPKPGEEPPTPRDLPVPIHNDETVDIVRKFAAGEVLPEDFSKQMVQAVATGQDVSAILNEGILFRIRFGIAKWLQNAGIIQRRLDEEEILQKMELDGPKAYKMLSDSFGIMLKIMEFLDRRTSDEAKTRARKMEAVENKEIPVSEPIQRIRELPPVKRDQLMKMARKLYQILVTEGAETDESEEE